MQCNNVEKINFELTARIRVVSCQVFFTFPVWINQDVVLVRVGEFFILVGRDTLLCYAQ